MLVFLDMILTAFAVARMHDFFNFSSRFFLRQFIPNIGDSDCLSFSDTKSEFVASNSHFNGVAHWGAFDHCDRCLGD